MIINKNSGYIELHKIDGEYWYVCANTIKTHEDVVIDLDYPIFFGRGIKIKGSIKSNVTIKSNYITVAGGNIISNGDIISTSITADNIKARGSIKVCGSITAKGYIRAGKDVKAAFGITADDINAGGIVKDHWWEISNV